MNSDTPRWIGEALVGAAVDGASGAAAPLTAANHQSRGAAEVEVSHKLRVAIIGATGIGKHHGKWYAMRGCEVVAFVGTSPETVARTRDSMAQIFGFQGAGCLDVREMLVEHKPDAVSVCSPHHLHREHTLACLEAGAHVLCEKPLVWDVAKSGAEMLADGESMISAAQQARRLLAVNTQYVAAIAPYLELYRKHQGQRDRIERLDFRMESKGGASGPNQYEEIWIDLASHPLSLMLRLLPRATFASDSATCVIGRDEVVAQFEMEQPGGRCPVRIELRNVYEGAMVRRFGVNGFMAELSGANDEQGIYRTHVAAAGERVQCEDLVHTSVRRFVEAVRGEGEPLATGAEALRNLELHLALLQRARRDR
jgi:predicted dehydrogenase